MPNNDNTPLDCAAVAECWERWCGITPWSKNLRRFGELGGQIIWWCGYPQSKSAIPLCFTLLATNGTKIPGNSRLKDIKAAVSTLTESVS